MPFRSRAQPAVPERAELHGCSVPATRVIAVRRPRFRVGIAADTGTRRCQGRRTRAGSIATPVFETNGRSYEGVAGSDHDPSSQDCRPVWPSITAARSCPTEGPNGSSGPSGRAVSFGCGVLLAPCQPASAPLNERVQSRAPDLARCEVAQDDPCRSRDVGITVDRSHDPIDIGRLHCRHFAKGQARELAEPEALIHGLGQRRQFCLQCRATAPRRRPGGRRGSGRFVLLGRTRPGWQAWQLTPIERLRDAVAGPQERAGVDPSRDGASVSYRGTPRLTVPPAGRVRSGRSASTRRATSARRTARTRRAPYASRTGCSSRPRGRLSMQSPLIRIA